MTPEWIRQHLVLQRESMIKSTAQLHEAYAPPHVLETLTGKFIMVCRPRDSGATVIRPELVQGRHVIVLSMHLVPTTYPPQNFPADYVALVLLHELAHIWLGHCPPGTDQMEEDAYELALTWFNESHDKHWTMKDLRALHEEQDKFWLIQQLKKSPNKRLEATPSSSGTYD